MKAALSFFSRIILSMLVILSVSAHAACKKTLTLEFKNNPQIHAFLLGKPDRLVIDYSNKDQLITALPSLVDNQCLKRLRTNPHHHKGMRVVYDLSTQLHLTTKVEKNAVGYSVTMQLSETGQPSHATRTVPKAKPVVKKPAAPPITPLRDIIVVIDPGHGGMDPGAIAVNGAREKNIALQIAKRLATRLRAIDGIQVYLTRDHDTYVELRKRTEFAQKKHADLFVSIHADSHPNGRAHGVSVYALSESGATSEAARILADKENTLYDSNDKHAHHGFVLESVLIDLQQVSTVHQSLYLGKMILKHIALVANRHSRHVEQAAFVVLKSPTIPSVLIETGFLSNKKEAKKLSSRVYQENLANGFTQAVKEYFIAHRVENSFFEVAQNHQTIHVVAGDTLAKIAAKHGVRIQDLQHINHLESHHIHTGQKLWLPRKKI